MSSFDDETTLTFTREHARSAVIVRDWGVATSLGHVRLENQDFWGHRSTTRFAVADGMGGTSGGLLAAECSVKGFMEIEASSDWVPQLVELNRSVSQISKAEGFAAAGSTLIGIDIEQYRCVTIHIGDSRIYRLRNQILQLLTKDHNLGNLRQEQGLDPELSDERGPPRALTSWIGAPEEPDRIDIGTLSVQQGDRILLVTDGVSAQLDAARIESILSNKKTPQQASQTLVDEADAAGGKDNATALVVDLGVNE